MPPALPWLLLCYSMAPPMLFHVTSYFPCLLLCYSWPPPMLFYVSSHLPCLFPWSSVFSSHVLRVPSYVIYGLLIFSSTSHPTLHVSFYSPVSSSHALPCLLLRCSWSPPMPFYVISYLPCPFPRSSVFSSHALMCFLSSYVIYGLLLFISMFYCMLFLSTYTLPCFLSPIASSHTLPCLILYFSVCPLTFFYTFLRSSMSPHALFYSILFYSVCLITFPMPPLMSFCVFHYSLHLSTVMAYLHVNFSGFNSISGPFLIFPSHFIYLKVPYGSPYYPKASLFSAFPVQIPPPPRPQTIPISMW
jgi:hypothetical protein